jgi:hypothetical protein
MSVAKLPGSTQATEAMKAARGTARGAQAVALAVERLLRCPGRRCLARERAFDEVGRRLDPPRPHASISTRTPASA